MLDPAIRDVAQANYATALSSLVDRAVSVLRSIIGDRDVVSDMVAAMADMASDLTVAHLELMLDEPIAVAPDVSDVVRVAVGEIDAGVDLAQVTSKLVFTAAATAAESANAITPSIRFWVRVTSPGETCGLCVQASTRVYKTAFLKPIHDDCRCTVRPLLPDESVTEFKTKVQPLYERVQTELDAIDGRIGTPTRTTGRRRQRSRASNVRVDTPEPTN